MLHTPLRRAVAVAAALVFAAACADEFAVDPPEGFSATIEAEEWPDALVVGDTLTLHVVVRDENTGTAVDPAGIDWTVQPSAALQLLAADGDSVRFRVASLGSIQLRASLDDPAFDTASVAVTMPSVVDHIDVAALDAPAMDAFGDTVRVGATAFDHNGEPFPLSAGYTWTTHGDAITTTGPQSAGELRVVGAANGSAWVVASLAQCRQGGVCRDSVLVDVAQVVTTVVTADTIALRRLGASASIGATARDHRGAVAAGATLSFTQLDGAGSVGLTGSTVTALARGASRIVVSSGAIADTVVVSVTQVPASVTLSVDSVRLGSLGESVQLTAIVRDSGNAIVDSPDGLMWETTAAQVASVTPGTNATQAIVTAAGNGSAVVRARIGAVTDEASVTVQQVVVSAVAVGGTDQSGPISAPLPDSLRVEARDALGAPVAGAAVSWSVLLGGGSVSGSSITGATGRAAVAWTLGSLVGTQRVRAIVAGVDTVVFDATGTGGTPTQITVTPATATLTFVADTAHLSATVRDGFGNVVPAAVTWSSTNEAVATVSAGGIVTAAGSGSARIVATSGALADSADITVTQHVASITLAPPGPDTLAVGDTLRLVATARDSGGTTIANPSILWSSTDTAIATVDATGRITARARGSVTIRATANGSLASFSLTVASFALAFDGGDLLEVANAPALVLDSAFTIELWVRPQTTTGGALIATWNGTKTGSSYAIYLRGLVPRAYVRGAGTGNTPVDSVGATTGLVPGAWSHVAFVYDHGVGTLYVNGVLSGTSPLMAHPNPATAALRIGADALSTPTFLTGDIDEIRIWRRARSAAEILAEQTLRLPASATGLAVYYPLSLGTGDPVDIVGGLVAVRGGSLGVAAAPGWITDGAPAP